MDLTNATWRKATRSGSNGGDCVEVTGVTSGVIAIRDSKHPESGHLTLSRTRFHAFTKHLKTTGH
ncbi:DUF397 domain-containing protein [Actinocorallia longicatena]|uniref:DUF397 domain-containing protein n=1 Tax=Actinocorallia longicatena TaxID=111803 RepID=A0ABP6Q2H4_9ACTN